MSLMPSPTIRDLAAGPKPNGAATMRTFGFKALPPILDNPSVHTMHRNPVVAKGPLASETVLPYPPVMG